MPPEILNKRGPLTRAEFALVSRHPIWGIELLGDAEFLPDVRPIIRWHHERHDGTGYPDGLSGEEIPLPAQIVALADAYDALTSDRAYRPALSPGAAFVEMAAMRGGWSADLFDRFVHTHARSSGTSNYAVAF